MIGYLVVAGGRIAGMLIDHDAARLAQLAERLVRRGLVFSYERGPRRVYTAHPFLRDYFRTLLGVDSETLHEAVRAKLVPSLELSPSQPPSDRALLDRYEELIEHTVLAGQMDEASGIYMTATGTYRHLGRILGDYSRGSRMLALFDTASNIAGYGPELSNRRRSYMLTERGLFAGRLGELSLAAQCFDEALRLDFAEDDLRSAAQDLINRAEVAIWQAEFPKAIALTRQAVALSDDGGRVVAQYDSRDKLAIASHYAGDEETARTYFDERDSFSSDALGGAMNSRHRYHFDLGDVDRAEALIREELAHPGIEPSTGVRRHALLARIIVRRDLAAARSYLELMRRWTSTTGDVEMVAEAHLVAAEIALRSGDLPGAGAEACTGLNLADGCGFGLLSIELLIVMARASLAIPDAQTALRHAREALDRSQRPECGYAWGEADALHLCGIAHHALGEMDLAKRRLEAAIIVRDRIGHPALNETKQALGDLSPSA
jgi:tetratricopeptide (TPR) repeat protein